MKRTRGRAVDIETLADLDHRLAVGGGSMDTWRLHGLDLTDRGAALLSRRVAGVTLLGCRLAPGDERALREAGALVLPEVGDSPLEVYRPRLYTAEELYDTVVDGGRYDDSLDARGYAWAQRVPDREDALAAALHDHAIGEALAAWVADRRDAGHGLVGVMGGHALERGTDGYADAARLGRSLARAGRTVATGGGPGAMEAANLGARLADAPDSGLAVALDTLAAVASFRPVEPWVEVARRVLAGVPDPVGTPVETLGVPTWFYGHEPPNPFATAIAKYVSNATREAVLLEICDAGIVFLPGAGGTVQEVFQDACENYYAEESSVAPMVLVGQRYWTEVLPAWPLLASLARDRVMASGVHLVDSVDAAADLIG